ncbi:HRDC domain-containing protein [Leptolyngbya sp. 15MV]|nr:HRDC domain-containing protein [Leptolyngbya sp. 15MV]
MLIDSHCHLEYEGLVEDRQGVLERARAVGVHGFLNISTRQSEWARVVGTAERESDVWASVGIHPHEADQHVDLGSEMLLEASENPRVIGIGESGLDYYYDKSDRQVQRDLTGAGDERVRQRGHDRLSVYGIVDGEEARLLQPLSRALQARGALVANEHGGLALGGEAKAILRGEQPVGVVVPKQSERRGRRSGGGANPVGDPLFEALRELRRDLAREAQIPPYVIFHDATLREMATTRPGTREELGRVAGVGAKKLDAYGDQFLSVIRRH